MDEHKRKLRSESSQRPYAAAGQSLRSLLLFDRSRCRKRGCRWGRANDKLNWCLLLRTDGARDLPLVNEWGKRSTYGQALLIRTIPQPEVLVLGRHFIRLCDPKPINRSSAGRQDTEHKSQESKRQAAEKLENPSHTQRVSIPLEQPNQPLPATIQ